jgi:hypothetical protein
MRCLLAICRSRGSRGLNQKKTPTELSSSIARMDERTHMDNTTAARLPSDRKFGIGFALFLSIIGISAALKHWGWMTSTAALIGSVIIGAIALTVPTKLAILNRGWFYLGAAMGKTVSSVVLGVIFFGILTPIAIITRLFGRDELRLGSCATGSYWIRRDASDSMAESFRDQF